MAAVLYSTDNYLQGEQAATAYREGRAAAQNKDWDRAVLRFSQAGAYRDAPRQAQNARQTAADRNESYAQGVQAGTTGDFWTAVSLLQRVADLQPGYKDTAARLAQVREEALEYGLGGLVYATSGGGQPGLYLIESLGQHHYLPGSDGQSRVRATSPAGEQLVYDGPATGSAAFAPGDPGPPSGAPDRIVIRGQVLAGYAVITDTIPQLNSQGRGTFATTGLWWYDPPLSRGQADGDLVLRQSRRHDPDHNARLRRAGGATRAGGRAPRGHRPPRHDR